MPLTVDLRPPGISVENGLTYIRRGGAAAVVYELDEETLRDGVEVGEDFHRGYPLPASGGGDSGRRIALGS